MRMSSNIVFSNNQSKCSFLDGFVESSVEITTNGSNRDCIIHYGGEHSKYEMMVKLVGGEREGDAMILNDGVPFIRLHYERGSLTGAMERMNEYGVVDMRGKLVNGVESGLFEEYGRGKKVVWRGYYRNGVRYSEVKSTMIAGYYYERSVDTGALLSIAQYDDSLHDKNGRCMEYENGEWVGDWMYENGVKGRPIRVYRNGTLSLYDEFGKKILEGRYSKEDVKNGFCGYEAMEGMDGYYKEMNSQGELVSVSEYDEMRIMKKGNCYEMENGKVKRVCLYENGEMKRVMTEFNGSTMIEYDNNGKRIYEGEFKGDMKNGFVREGKGKEYVVSKSSGTELTTDPKETLILIGSWRNGKKHGYYYEVDVNGTVKRRCLYVDDEMIQVILEFNERTMTEYDEIGKRVYEGEFKGDMESGFVREGKGREFTNEGRAVLFSGNWKNGNRDGMGTEFKGFKPVYTGGWKDGKRDGEGEEMDEDGEVVRNGWWVNGVHENDIKYTMVPSSLAPNALRIEELVIENSSFNDWNVTELRLIGLVRLKRVVIGDDCFGKVRVFELDSLMELESVTIGEKCFTFSKTEDEINNNERSDGDCRIVNCPKLKSLQLGDYSFSDYCSFELTDLSSLHSIDIGVRSFYYDVYFSLTGFDE